MVLIRLDVPRTSFFMLKKDVQNLNPQSNSKNPEKKEFQEVRSWSELGLRLNFELQTLNFELRRARHLRFHLVFRELSILEFYFLLLNKTAFVYTQAIV